VAVIEDGLTVELFFDPVGRQAQVGAIYKGRVVRVLASMQCAFVEVGLSRTAFLYVADMLPHGRTPGTELPAINTLVRQGDELLVQVTREAVGTKGARLTTQLTVPGRSVVLRPGLPGVSLSRRIADPDEQERLRALALACAPEGQGLIIRTAAVGVDERAFAKDVAEVSALWEAVEAEGRSASAPTTLHEDMDITLRSVRDLLVGPNDRVLVDDPEELERIRTLVRRSAPELEGQIEYWEGPDPLFERFGVEWEISRATRKRVWLKSGGTIVIDRGEALTAIDVNTGKYTGDGLSFADTVLHINLEAVEEIAYQLRFRDIGGLVVIDFIDMHDPAHQAQVYEALVARLSSDRARTRVLPVSALGLIEMTRKKVRDSIVEGLTEPCYYCDGRGRLTSVDVTVERALSQLRQRVSRGHEGALCLQAHPRVAEALIEGAGELIADLEAQSGLQIQIIAQEERHLESIDIHHEKSHA
jgi:ribonuclease G